jgi:hypothetical protein
MSAQAVEHAAAELRELPLNSVVSRVEDQWSA